MPTVPHGTTRSKARDIFYYMLTDYYYDAILDLNWFKKSKTVKNICDGVRQFPVRFNTNIVDQPMADRIAHAVVRVMVNLHKDGWRDYYWKGRYDFLKWLKRELDNPNSEVSGIFYCVDDDDM